MIKNKLSILLFCLGISVLVGCRDEFSDHYDRSADLPATTLYGLLKQNSNLSTFARLVEKAGYDTLLSSTQTFTVFAPVNDGLAGINPDAFDVTRARTFVNNQIARFNNSTSVPAANGVRMKNYKLYSFSSGKDAFGGATLVDKNIMAKNGLLHTLNGPITYRNNVHEYITSSDNTTKLEAFIKTFDETRFDESLSIPIDINQNGSVVYDSVKTTFNRLLDKNLGSIANEDSIYTMVIPTDNAWDEAYTKYSAYFKTYNANAAVADSIRKVQASQAILNDLIYRGRIDDSNLPDSIVSTSGSVVHNPASLLSGTNKQDASNGLTYFTDHLNYNGLETWNKKIVIECEEPEGRLAGANTGINTRIVSSGANIPVSNSRYIEVSPNTTTAQPAVTFDIPNVLSGKYNIYVECLPGSIDDAPKDSTKLLFDLTYLTATGKTTNVTVKLNSFVTSGKNKVVIKAFSSFEFPVANFYDRIWWIDYFNGLHSYSERVVTTKFMVKTNVSTSEINNNIFSRKFRIDRIIFEPVIN